jgi:hypothetical protein
MAKARSDTAATRLATASVFQAEAEVCGRRKVEMNSQVDRVNRMKSVSTTDLLDAVEERARASSG